MANVEAEGARTMSENATEYDDIELMFSEDNQAFLVEVCHGEWEAARADGSAARTVAAYLRSDPTRMQKFRRLPREEQLRFLERAIATAERVTAQQRGRIDIGGHRQ